MECGRTERDAGLTMRTIHLQLDEGDYRDINAAIARRQRYDKATTVGGGNLAGRILGEICRGWMDRLDAASAEEEGL